MPFQGGVKIETYTVHKNLTKFAGFLRVFARNREGRAGQGNKMSSINLHGNWQKLLPFSLFFTGHSPTFYTSTNNAIQGDGWLVGGATACYGSSLGSNQTSLKNTKWAT
jgi:hypothetical protein